MNFRKLMRRFPIKTRSIDDFINTVRIKKGKDITMMPLFEPFSPLSIFFYSPATGFVSNTSTGRPIILKECYNGACLYIFHITGTPMLIPAKEWIVTAYNRLTKIKEGLPDAPIKIMIAGEITDEKIFQRLHKKYSVPPYSATPYKLLEPTKL